jgi:hypothetical protein
VEGIKLFGRHGLACVPAPILETAAEQRAPLLIAPSYCLQNQEPTREPQYRHEERRQRATMSEKALLSWEFLRSIVGSLKRRDCSSLII